MSDELWASVELLLPPDRPKPKGGRPRASDRAALAGILFVLRTGIPWEYVPREMGVCGMTCWRRLRDWQGRTATPFDGRVGPPAPRAAGTAARRRQAGLAQGLAGQRRRPGEKGGAGTGPNPTGRGKAGAKRHVVVDGEGTVRGMPRTGLTLSPANRHDSTMLAATLDAIPPVRRRRGPGGRPRRRPDKLHTDKGYDHRFCRIECRRRGITPRIARRGVEDSRRLGRHRRKVERTLAWMARFRRLVVVRYERRDDIHLALTILAAALICLNQISRFC